MMRRCKRGSSLIIVLILFSVLSILGTAILGLTVSNYKLKIVKGRIKENLYASEAGIDESYKIISKVIDTAINESNIKIDEFTKEEMNKEIEKEKTKQELKAKGEINDDIEEAEWDINNKGSEYITVDSNGIFITDELENQQNIKFKEYYKSYIENNLFKENGSTITLKDDYIYELSRIKPSVTINGAKPNFEEVSSNNYLLSINLKSSFKDNKGIEKIIEAIYEVSVPEYGQDYKFSTNTIRIPNMVWSKALAVDGNMFVNEGNLTVGEEKEGVDIPADIYVKGINGVNGGINFNVEKSNTNIIGNISTAEDFIINKGSTNIITGNIFSRNVILNDTAIGSTLTVNKIQSDAESGSVYTTDDLELNADRSRIDIKGSFYGIDDGSFEDIQEFNNNKYGKANKSSTIIINADLNSGSTLTIAGDSIITGVGYIDVPYVNLVTGETGQYQTGESVAIKGNYRAYTFPLTGDVNARDNISLNEKNVTLEYFEPLILASSLNNEKRALFAQEKSKYFEAYNNEYKDKGGSNLMLNGVSLGANTFSTGAIVSNGEIKPQHILIEEGDIIKKRNVFNKMVNNMGVKVKISASEKEKNDTYPSVPNKIFGNKDNNPDEECKLDISKLKEVNELKNGEYTFIKKGDATLDFNTTSKGAKKGIIIVTGNLTIKGQMDFTGTIIVGGNLTFEGPEEKKIKYDKGYIGELIISNYYELFKDVFINDNIKNVEESWNTVINASYGLEVNGDKLIQKSQLIKTRNWTISK
ncbi:hypothetical protein LGK97_07825 [Clostridium sp. CS001]|uniref:pilus assembly PilX N-terminal domain-containing protein n=1 Tax=Clostridium sp. CS001 TaxID=2880648 RepID=UPI001CF4B06B|nr:pilus assembly PilX N-terminal domain-containing protein [Clostridium sp. CS001]MCB2289671.1 hypothetical protein [Clostridium sp. CS001]